MPDGRHADAVEARLARLEAAVARLQARQARRQRPALIDALEGFFGPGRFTVAGLLGIADDEPHSDIGRALADVVDLAASARSRATALGMLLSKMDGIEVVDAVRGASVFRVVDAE